MPNPLTLQQRVDAGRMLPRRDSTLAESLLTRFSNATLIGGRGRVEGVPNPHAGGVAYTRLVVTDPAVSEAIRVRGRNTRIENLTLHGAGAGRGVLLTDVEDDGLGVGLVSATRLCISNFAVGIRAGEATTDSNCDTSVWDQLIFEDCGVAWDNVNHMAMEHTFRDVHFHACGSGLRVYAGGRLHIQGGFGLDVVLWDFQASAGASWNPSPGTNNASFTCERFKVDARHAGAFQLMRGDVAAPITLTVKDLHIGGDDPYTLATLAPGHTLVLRDMRVNWQSMGRIERSTVATGQTRPTLILDNVPEADLSIGPDIDVVRQGVNALNNQQVAA